MKFHRFDPYWDVREKKARENAERSKEFRKSQTRIDDPDRKKKIQQERAKTMRAKKIKVTLPVVSLALFALLYPQPAGAHCYSRWYYPYPQHCGGVYNRVGIKHDLVYRIYNDPPLPPEPQPTLNFPLPDMNATWGGAMDSELELEMQRQKALRLLKGGN
jgi:hypothetical protein